jgi:hypothetical protein
MDFKGNKIVVGISIGILVFLGVLYGAREGDIITRDHKTQTNTMNKENLQWFTHKGCTSLEIEKYKSISDPQIIASATITDMAKINSLMERIEKLPVDGDVMISFSENAANTNLIFKCDKGDQVIEIYDGGFKTPSTGFNTDSDVEEKELINEIEGYLK